MSEEIRQPQVFISYSRRDLAFVEQLAADLQSAGLDVWYDLSGLEGGARWSREIQKAIRESQYMLVVLSPDSVASIWVEEEILYARKLKRKIVPLFYKPCDLPFGFHTLHFIDVQGSKYKRNFNEVLRALDVRPTEAKKQHIQKKAKSVPVKPEKKEETPKPKKERTKLKWDLKSIGLLITIVALSLALVFGLPPLLPQPDNTPEPTLTLTTEVEKEPISTPTETFTPIPTVLRSSNCSPYADSFFNYALSRSPEIASALGKQVMNRPICIQSSYQPFEGGEMIWRSDDPDIYVLFADHKWSAYKNNYRYKNPTETPCNLGPPPNNRLKPLLGFGKIWCDNQGAREKLGYATIGESADDRAILTFENGWLILINYTVRAVFYDKGLWDSIDVFDFVPILLESRSDLDTNISNLGLEQKESITLPKAPLIMLDPVTGKMLVIPFRVGSKISSQCAYKLEHPETIQIPVNIPHPVRVYLLIQAGWGVRSYEYQTIGNVLLKFDNGEPIETPLVLGYNIRDWADRSIAITTLVSPYAQIAWEGFDEVPGKIEILILDIPDTYISSTLKEIQIDDRSKINTGSLDPCIHLSAVTVSYLPYLQLP